MTSHKLCQTFLVVVSVSAIVTGSSLHDSSYQPRARRSSDAKQSAESTTPDDADDVGFQGGYRFGDEFFLPEASRSIPAEYKKKADGCERVVKDSMVCMVCKDPKTNAKYEQCSYVGNPPPKASSASTTTATTRQPTDKRVSYAADDESSGESAESSTPPRGSRGNYESSSPGEFSTYESSTPPRGDYETRQSSTPPRSDYENRESSTPPRNDYETRESATPSRNDYETRETSTPSRNDYEISETSTPSRGDYEISETSTPSRGDYSTYESSKPEATGYSYKDYAPAPYSYSPRSNEESASSEDPAESSDCRQIERGSESCRICKDPKTGKDFERCSSSFRPDDKSYAYGKTERYGYPESAEDDKDDKDDTHSGLRTFENDGAKSADVEDPAETSECRQVRKDDQTCTICKDPKTGGDSERCSSSYRPADESYAYGTSEKFGGPGAAGKDEDYGSSGKFGGPATGGKSDDYKYDDRDDREDEKSADATYEIPAEYQSAYQPRSNDESYKNYRTDVPEDYSRSIYDAGSAYDAGSPSGGYGAGAEYAAPSVPAAATKPSGNGGADGCREVRKDSMTCTVCADPKTGGNFEKCSYAYQPDDKVYKFTKSKTFGYPEVEKSGRDGTARESAKSYNGGADSARQSESKKIEAVRANPCKEIQRDSMVCTVCRDPTSGASSEQCAYGTIPSEKLFAQAASKALGNSDEGRASGGRSHKRQESRQVPRWSAEDVGQSVAESKQIAEKIRTNGCRKIEKGSMTCTVCKDPKTGASSEQCSYSSRPKENHYTYSKSKSSGSPKKGEEKEEEEGERQQSRETKENAEAAEATNPCRKIEKESMTCTVCKDPKTGENSEQCAYTYKPKERHFTYTKSKSFGNPRKDGKGGGNGSQEEKPEETHQISRWSNDDYYAKVNRPRGFSKPEWTYGE